MNKTIWKEIKGYENEYLISNKGDVKSLYNDILLKPFDNKGYLRVLLYKNGKNSKHLVHRLVAEAFINNPNNYKQVNHKDLNKKNNNINNLEWVNGSENVRHAIKNTPGRKEYLQEKMSDIGTKYGKIGIEASKKPVMQIDKNTDEVIEVFENAREASRKTDSNYKNISQVCNGKRITHNGYKWKFV